MTTSPAAVVRATPNLTVFEGSLIVLGTGVAFSFGGLAFRLTDDVTAWQFVIFRGLGAFASTLIILAVRYRRGHARLLAMLQPSHIGAGVILGGISTVFIVSLEYASVAFVLFLQALAPIAAAYFSWWLLHERVSRAAMVATVVSIVGVGIMVSATVTDAVEPLGLVALAIPIFFGLYATLIRRAQAIDPQVPVLVGGATLIIVGLLVAPIVDGLDISRRDALLGLFAGSVLLAIPAAIMNHASRVVPAPEIALLLMSEVVLAPLWVWMFVDERPHVTTLVGGSVILSAVAGLLVWRRTQGAYNQ